jgi:hypothetical protein
MGFFDWLLGPDNSRPENRERVFISFAIKDKKYRDFLVAQAKNSRTPFDFVDMSVKERYDEDEWQKRCRTKIRRCDCMIVLLSRNTWHSKGARWEIKCGREERLRVTGMHINKNDKGAIPTELEGCKIIEWSWNNLKKILN